MLWLSNTSTEFPAVRDFAIQKKLAIMSAHDSILSACVKQTRDANRKRRVAPFKKGELVYLSTKNLSFAKGLARKLIPKYIGPYKILHDFGNSSFRLEIPSHLKQRGVHNSFHASLLREHIPNDDRLFPGRMDSQLGSEPDTEGEWAVDSILSHSGSNTDSIFEIKWKSGDITWLPYYQITHLQALTDYLDLLGIKNISTLPKGAGQPPREDPQLFLGLVSFSPQPILPPTTPERKPLKASHRPSRPNIPKSTAPSPSHSFTRTYTIHTDSYNIMPPHRGRSKTKLLGIDHPSFTRTTYLMREPDYPVHTKIHMAQIYEYLHFDEQLRTDGESAKFHSVPVGFSDFSTTWNNGAAATDDPRRVSTVFLAEDAEFNYATPSHTPVYLHEFHITPEQAGLVTSSPPDPKSSAAQAEINLEMATILVARQKKQRMSYEERQQKRLEPFAVRKNANASSSARRLFRKPTHKPSKHPEPVPTISSTTLAPPVENPPADDDENDIRENDIPNDSAGVSAPMEVTT